MGTRHGKCLPLFTYYGQSPFLMGKLTIWTGPWLQVRKLLVITGVYAKTYHVLLARVMLQSEVLEAGAQDMYIIT